MADIELVIKIPKYMFEDIQDRYRHPNKGYGINLLENAVANGITLPKGHGDLKDVSNLLTVTDYDGENEKTYVLYDEIKHAPTIVEADKAESEVQDADSN